MNYELRRNPRSRRLRIAVHSDGEVVVTAPTRMGESMINHYVAKHAAWIAKAQARVKRTTDGLAITKETVDRREFLREVKIGVEKWAAKIGVHPAKVSIRRMRSRWGSCSPTGNISISLLLGHLEPQLLEYVIIHELSHIAHHNHSKAFWSLVAAYAPDFKSRKKLLHRYGYLLRK